MGDSPCHASLRARCLLLAAAIAFCSFAYTVKNEDQVKGVLQIADAGNLLGLLSHLFCLALGFLPSCPEQVCCACHEYSPAAQTEPG